MKLQFLRSSGSRDLKFGRKLQFKASILKFEDIHIFKLIFKYEAHITYKHLFKNWRVKIGDFMNFVVSFSNSKQDQEFERGKS